MDTPTSKFVKGNYKNCKTLTGEIRNNENPSVLGRAKGKERKTRTKMVIKRLIGKKKL